MDGMMNGGGMQGGEGGNVTCPCCNGSGQCSPEMAEKCMEMMEPAESGDDTAHSLAAAMATKGPMMRKG